MVNLTREINTYLTGEKGEMIIYLTGLRGFIMTVKIEDTCTACGLCCDTCPEVFEMGDDMAIVKVDEVPSEYKDAVQQAADECPVEAIIVE